jgi:hypothetical protein
MFPVRSAKLANSRYGFLLNRYMVPTVLAAVFYGAHLLRGLEQLSDIFGTN